MLQWCESRGDCTYAIVCPTCSTQFLVDEDDLNDLERWTDSQGNTLVCGIRS
ncbi:MAG TPA: MJ0042-type zinc finger domain-containing protein [Thermomicrobiales bacterium]|nr:MJ0042-type zinc finger domain-containing protein [Thermomicrobiales bacterium]